MYKVIFEPEAENDLDKLDKTVAKRIIRKTEWLGKNADIILHHQLSSLLDELKGLCKVRVGDWRILYWIYHDSKTIKIYGIEHRSKVYRKM